MAKILVVEDDPEVYLVIRDWLLLEGHNVEIATSGKDASQLLRSFDFELVILDWNLPELTGPEILKAYRANGGGSQVIFLTGRSDLVSKTHGLDTGADDYLTKPIDLSELSARIRSRLRRPGRYQPTTGTFNGMHFDSEKRLVVVDEEEIQLTTKEFDLLEFLVRNRGTHFTARALRALVWSSNSSVLEDTVRVCIQAVRKKLGPKGNSIIQTRQGGGYFVDSGN